MLELGIGRSSLGVGPQEVAEQQGELLGERSATAYVHVGPAVAWPLTEVGLRPIEVVGTPHEPRLFQRTPETGHGLKRCNGDLDVDDRLGVEAAHRRRADVVDAQRDPAESAP